MTAPHEDWDVPTLLKHMNRLAGMGALVFVKWTCPGCGERAISDVPNTFNAQGYLHTEKADGSPCGALYTGPLYGAMVALVVPPPPPARTN